MSVQWSTGPQGVQRNAIAPELGQVVRIALMHDDHERAARALDEVFERNASLTDYLFHEIRYRQGRPQTDPAQLPLARVFHEHASDDEYVVEWYGSLLTQSGEVDEALAVYKRFLRTHAQNESIARLLRGLEGETEPAEKLPANLGAAVSADPKNARLRIALVRRLLDEGRYAEACEHALEAETIASHLSEARALARTALALCRRDAEYETRLADELEREPDTEKRYALAVQLAELRWARGEEDAAREIFQSVFDRDPSSEGLNPATWFWRKGRMEDARAFVEQGLARARALNPWMAEQFHGALAALAGPGDAPELALELADAIAEEHRGEEWELEHVHALSEAFAAAAGEPEAIEALRGAIGARDEPERSLYLASLDLACGEARRAEEALVAVALAERSVRALLPIAVELARGREDWSAALAHLDRVEPTYRISNRAVVPGLLGEISEREAHTVERGALKLALGDREGAESLWREAFPTGESGAAKLAAAFAENGLWDEAAESFARAGERALREDRGTILCAAAVAYRRGELERALELVVRAPEQEGDPDLGGLPYAMTGRSTGQDDPRAARVALLLELGRRDEAREFLHDELARAPEDAVIASMLVDLLAEVGERAALDALAEDWPGSRETSSLLHGTRHRLACRAGDWKHAAACAEQMLERSEDWEAQQWAQSLADALHRDGRVGEAVDFLRRADEDESHGEQRCVGWLLERELWREALAELDRASKAGTGGSRRDRCVALMGLDRDEEALEVLFRGIEDPRASAEDLWSDLAIRLAERTGARARVEAALAADPADRAEQRRALVLAVAVEDWRRAAELAQTLLDWPSAARLAQSVLWRALEGDGRPREALAALDGWMDRLDREQLLTSYPSPRGAFGPLRRSRIALVRELEGEARATQALRDPLGDRFRTPHPWEFRSFGFDDAARVELDEAWSLGLYRAFVERASRSQRLVSWSQIDVRACLARLRLGETDAAVEEVWQLACGSRRPEGNDHFRAVRYPDSSLAGPMLQVCLEAGRVDELLQRLATATAEPGARAHVLDAHAHVLAELGRWEDLAGLFASRADGDLDPAERVRWARALLAAGRPAEGLTQLERARAEQSGATAIAGAFEQGYFAPPSRGGRTRFRFGLAEDFGIRSFSSYSFSESWPDTDAADEDSVEEDALEAALLRACDRAEEAERVESTALARLRTAGVEHPALEMAEAYADLDRAADAERLFLTHAALGLEQASEAYRRLAEHASARGDASACGRHGDEWWKLQDELRPGAEAPERWRRAAWLARVGARAATIAEACAAARACAATSSYRPSPAQEGWIALAAEDAVLAVARFRAAVEGPAHPPSVAAGGFARAGLALALARAEGRDAARSAIWRALAEDPSGVHAPALWRALRE